MMGTHELVGNVEQLICANAAMIHQECSLLPVCKMPLPDALQRNLADAPPRAVGQ